MNYSHVPQQFKPLRCVPRLLLCGWRASHQILSRPATIQTAGLCRTGGYCEGGGRLIIFCHVAQQFKPLGSVAPVFTVRVAASNHLLSRPATVQTATLCLTSCYCEGVGRPITSCHVPQQFEPLGCVPPVVTVRVTGVPLLPFTSRNSSNRWAVSHRLLL
jgi:hypothetical protein